MAGEPRPWFRKGRNQWYATMNGEQVPLGVFGFENEKSALAALQALLKNAVNDSGSKPKSGPTVAEAIETFLAVRDGVNRPKSVKSTLWYASFLLAHFGTNSVSDLGVATVERWASKQGWASSTRRNVLAILETALREAGREVKFRKPPSESRGAKSVIPEAIYQQCLGAARGDFRALVRFLWLTGCRQCEAIGLVAADVDLAANVCRLADHKTAAKTGKPRLVYLPAAAVEVLREQIAKHPNGPLFTGKNGLPLTQHAVVVRFIRLSARIGHHVSAHCFRHSFCSRALVAGVPEAHVAALMGHTSTAMISKHYGHLGAFADTLKAAAERANGKPAA